MELMINKNIIYNLVLINVVLIVLKIFVNN